MYLGWGDKEFQTSRILEVKHLEKTDNLKTGKEAGR
jgi:hypothetical protein